MVRVLSYCAFVVPFQATGRRSVQAATLRQRQLARHFRVSGLCFLFAARRTHVQQHPMATAATDTSAVHPPTGITI